MEAGRRAITLTRGPGDTGNDTCSSAGDTVGDTGKCQVIGMKGWWGEGLRWPVDHMVSSGTSTLERSAD